LLRGEEFEWSLYGLGEVLERSWRGLGEVLERSWRGLGEVLERTLPGTLSQTWRRTWRRTLLRTAQTAWLRSVTCRSITNYSPLEKAKYYMNHNPTVIHTTCSTNYRVVILNQIQITEIIVRS